MTLCSDLDRSLAPDAIQRIVTSAAADGLKLLEAQARRALGVSMRDTVELTRALGIFEETCAVPYAARVRCERALLTGHQSELEAGLHVLARRWAISTSWPGWSAHAEKVTARRDTDSALIALRAAESCASSPDGDTLAKSKGASTAPSERRLRPCSRRSKCTVGVPRSGQAGGALLGQTPEGGARE